MPRIREIENIFTEIPGFRCFVCSPANDCGLRLRFFLDEEAGEAFTRFEPGESLSGFPGIIHGGIQTTLLDEAAFWAIFGAWSVLSVTAEITVQFTRPALTRSVLEVRAQAARPRHKLSRVKAFLRDEAGGVTTEADILAYVPDRNAWQERFGGAIPEVLLPYIPGR